MKTTSDLPQSRQAQLLSLVRRDGFVRIAAVSEALGVAPVTVRRDLAALAKSGEVEQVRGGARLATPPADSAQPPADALVDTVVGVVTPSLDYYWPSIIEGINSAADDRRVGLVLQGSRYAAEDNLREFRALAEGGRVQGLILVPELGEGSSAALLEFLEGLELPTVLMERTLRPTGSFSRTLESVVTDHRNGANMAVRYLRSLGHKRIGLLSERRSPSQEHITRGWHEACTELGLEQVSRLTEGDHRDRVAMRESSSAAIASFLDECIERSITAIVAHPDKAALTIIEHLLRRGIEVPRDMSVIAYDDELATLSRPALTAVSPPKRDLGRAALTLVTDRILQPDSPLQRIELQPSLIVRDSTVSPR